jgi:hypothetical protein
MKLSQIKIDPALQMRVGMDINVIHGYAERMLEGDKFPAVVVFNDGKDNWLSDGFNRVGAYKHAGIENIDADVRPGTRRDAMFYALSANAKNGQPRTPDDKRKAVMTMIDDVEWSEKSDREIAAICVVAHSFVSKLRKAAGKQPETITVQRGDQEYKVKSPAKEPKHEAVQEEEADETDKIFEMASEIKSMAEDLEAAERRIAVAAMEATPEEKKLAAVKLEEMADEVKSLSENNRVLRISRDTFQNECAELKKQSLYGKRRYEKAEKEIESLRKEVAFWKDRALTAEAHLAIDKAA